MKVVRLNENDIENLVKKIIKEDDFNWAQEYSNDLDNVNIFKVEISSWQEFVHYGKGTKWEPAQKGGERYYNLYSDKFGPFTVYIDRDSSEKYVCVGGRCFDKRDKPLTPEDLTSIFGVDLGLIPFDK